MTDTTTTNAAPDAAGQAGEYPGIIRLTAGEFRDQYRDHSNERLLDLLVRQWAVIGTLHDKLDDRNGAIDSLVARCAAAERERDALVAAIVDLRAERMRFSLDEAHLKALAWFRFARTVDAITPPPAEREEST